MTKSTFSITIRGQIVNGAKIGSFKKSLVGLDERISTFANAAAAQLVISGNRNWLDDLFSLDEMRLKSGKLSAKGRSVAKYIRAFAPIGIVERNVNGVQMIAVKINAKNKGVFYRLEKNEDGAQIKIDASEEPTWGLTLREFENRDKEKNGNGKGNKKAVTLTKALETALAALNEGKVSGSTNELMALAESAESLRQAAFATIAMADTGLENVESVSAEKAQAVSGGKETRADTNRERHAATAF